MQGYIFYLQFSSFRCPQFSCEKVKEEVSRHSIITFTQIFKNGTGLCIIQWVYNSIQLKEEGNHVGSCPTGSVLLPGGEGIRYKGTELVTLGPDGEAAEQELEERLGKDVAEHLQESYGGTWLDVAARTAEDESLGERIIADLPYIWAELDHAVENELVMTLRDFMRRRTQLEIRDAVGSWAVADAVGRRMASLMDWSPEQTQAQVADYLDESGRSMAWRDEA